MSWVHGHGEFCRQGRCRLGSRGDARPTQNPQEPHQAKLRPCSGQPELRYPFHEKTVVVTHCGRICLGKKKINLSQAFADQTIGIKEVPGDIRLVTFRDFDLRYSSGRDPGWRGAPCEIRTPDLLVRSPVRCRNFNDLAARMTSHGNA